MRTTDERHMALALDQARQALLAGEAPVGACLLHDGRLTPARNAVIAGPDPTAHAELEAIRAACREHRRVRLAGARLYVTVEPCAMCRGACHYAGVEEILYGASLADLQAITGSEAGAGPAVADGPRLTGGLLRDQSLALLRTWAERRSA